MTPIGRRGWRREGRLRERLRSERPQAPDDLVRRIVAELSGTRRRHVPAPRLVLASAVSAAAIVAFGSVGGIGAAFAAAGNAASSVAKAAGANSGKKADKIEICHATGSSSNPFVTVTVDNNSTYEGHGAHPGDIIPAPGDGCPDGDDDNGGGNGGGGSDDDDNGGGNGGGGNSGGGGGNGGGGNSGGGGGGNSGNDDDDDDDDRIEICHATGSATNPYVEIEVSANGLNGHGGHPDDIIPEPAGGCPDGDTPGEDQYKPGKGCGDKNHVHFKEGKCKDEKDEKEKKDKKDK